MVLSVRSTVEPIDPAIVPRWVSMRTVDLYFQMALATVMVYDTIITMRKEITYFWKIPRKPVDFVYFANRYIGIFGAVVFMLWNSYNVDITICGFSAWTKSATGWLTVILIDYILVIRVLALYAQDKRLAIILYTLLVLEAAFKLGLFIHIGLLQPIAIGGLARDRTVCGVTATPPQVWGVVSWVIPLAYAIILMVLALYKATEYWKLSAGFKGFTLVKILIRDQVVYFMLVITCSIFATLVFKINTTNDFLASILSALGSTSLLSVLGSRMLLNLKAAGERGQNEGTNIKVPMRTITQMDFVEPVVTQRENNSEGIVTDV